MFLYGYPSCYCSTCASGKRNILFIRVTSVSGILLPTFGLFLQHCIGKRSWYIFTLTAVAAVFSTVVWIRTSTVTFDTLLNYVKSTSELSSCGNQNPVRFCGGLWVFASADNLWSLSFSAPETRRMSIIWLCSVLFAWIVLTGLLADLLWTSLKLSFPHLQKPLTHSSVSLSWSHGVLGWCAAKQASSSNKMREQNEKVGS